MCLICLCRKVSRQHTYALAECCRLKYLKEHRNGGTPSITAFRSSRSCQAMLGEDATIELAREKWLTLTNGTHQLRVEAVDDNFATSVRVWNFSETENTIVVQFSSSEETDARATKILSATP